MGNWFRDLFLGKKKYVGIDPANINLNLDNWVWSWADEKDIIHIGPNQIPDIWNRVIIPTISSDNFDNVILDQPLKILQPEELRDYLAKKGIEL